MESSYCACGCSSEVSPGRTFVHGHNRKGYSWTPSQRKYLTVSNRQHGFKTGHIPAQRIVPSGESHYRWKGGRLHRGNNPESIRQPILKRDGYCCTRCGSNRRLNVHHKDGNERNNKRSNLTTLYHSCHSRHHALEAVA